MERIYRFRPLDKLLGEEYEELKRQEIYFAPPDGLNDPLEGFKNLFWKGDAPIWKNLLRHYIFCLERICALYVIDGNNFLLKEEHIPVFGNVEEFPTVKYKKIFDEICVCFFSDPIRSGWDKKLATRAEPIKQNELYVYLLTVHQHALDAIFRVYESNGLVQKNSWPTMEIQKNDPIGTFIEFANTKSTQKPEIEGDIERFSASVKHLHAHNLLVQDYNGFTDEISSKNKKFLIMKFPEVYLSSLERLVYSDWYVASFLKSFCNPAMWGLYAESHKSVCLIFKANNGGLNIECINGAQFAKGKEITYSRGWVHSKFHKVTYQKKYPEIDFFSSLGKLPMPTLLKMWHLNDDGSCCPSVKSMHENVDEWRREYWSNFQKVITTKLTDWSFEQEYRLMLHPVMLDLTDVSKRKCKYNFSDLEGIIFGIKTSEEHKEKIIKIIEQKCRKESRNDFKFYQAFYSTQTGKIEAADMNLRFEGV